MGAGLREQSGPEKALLGSNTGRHKRIRKGPPYRAQQESSGLIGCPRSKLWAVTRGPALRRHKGAERAKVI